MNEAILKIFAMPLFCGVILWYIMVSYILYWESQPTSISRSAARLICCASPFGFVFVLVEMFSNIADRTTAQIFMVELIGTLFISIILTVTTARKRIVSNGRLVDPGSSYDSMPVAELPKVLMKGLAAVALAVFCLFLLPRTFVHDNALLLSFLAGPLLGVCLFIFGVPIFRKKPPAGKKPH